MLLCFVTNANAQQSIFPAQQTSQSGVTSYGYLNENGEIALPFTYETAGDFSDSGLAAVENAKHETGVIDYVGNLIISYTDAPITVEFGEGQIAYRYETKTVFYNNNGKYLGTYPYTTSFFCDGRLLVSEHGPYYYYLQDGSYAIAEGFLRAGDFKDGYALVQCANKGYYVIDKNGEVQTKIEDGYIPAYMELFGSTVVVTSGSRYYLYSIKSNSIYSDGFQYISAFENDVATVKSDASWGLLTTTGSFRVKPTYYSMTYLGDGVYAARALDGSVMAVDENGNSIYRTDSFVGGFETLRYGICWHGTADGHIIFFTKNGGYLTSLMNAENPYLLSENIVRVTQDGELKYINISTGKIIYTPPNSYALGGGIKAQTQKYYKFLGYDADGAPYAWDVTIPVISGLPDTQLQAGINEEIINFFLKGPSITAEYIALSGTYGISLEGSVLVVWANYVSGIGDEAAVWNQSIALDTQTGEQYMLSDLLIGDYNAEIKDMLPSDRYENPRLSTNGITYYYNEYDSVYKRAISEAYFISFSELDGYIDTESACYQALKTPYTVKVIASFTDVPSSHWAFDVIEQVSQLGLMQGYDSIFRPEDTISFAEATVVAARACGLTTSAEIVDGIDGNTWYAGEVSAAIRAGFLNGLVDEFEAAAAISRQDAMQIFANIITLTATEKPDQSRQVDMDATLAAFEDADEVAQSRREAIAVCVRAGLVEGDNGMIRPTDNLTRAQFAKLILAVYKDKQTETGVDVQDEANASGQ